PIGQFQPGEYEVMLHDVNGFSQVGSFKIVAPAPPTTTKKDTPTAPGKTKPGKQPGKNQTTKPTDKPADPTKTPSDENPVSPGDQTPKEPTSTTKEAIEREIKAGESLSRLPIYKGCKKSNRGKEVNCTEDKIQNFVRSHFEYPAEARRKNVEGLVIIAFFVETDGSIGEVNILKDIGAGCGAHALEIIKKLPRFEAPGKNRKGEAVRMLYKLPVNFKLG
ncbi:MAG: TonB family protein, partial [Bacteroidota bacterium]